MGAIADDFARTPSKIGVLRMLDPLGPQVLRAPSMGGHRKLFCRKTMLPFGSHQVPLYMNALCDPAPQRRAWSNLKANVVARNMVLWCFVLHSHRLFLAPHLEIDVR